MYFKRMKSLTFFVGIFIIFACFKNALTDKQGKKILILGAGMSGISAAKTLHDHGYTNIHILEGSDRVGGRVKSVDLSEYTLELGAQWIYGAGTNPMMKLASEYNLDYKVDPDTWTFRDALGNDLTGPADEEYEKLEKVLENVDAMSTAMRTNGTSDITAEALLRFCGWKTDNTVAEAVEVYEIDIETGRETPALSGKYLYLFNVFKEHGDDTWYVVNDTRGYGFVIEKLKESFLPNGDERLVFNKNVTRIENWNRQNSKVQIYSEDGTLYEADYVIVTFSLGVLQSRNVIFRPSLPDWKLMAIDKFGIGHYAHLYFKFKTAFWDNTSSIIYVPKRHGEHCVWLNMNFFLPGCNILQLSISGAEAKAADNMEDSELIANAMKVLRSMYPLANISEPENFVTSRWMSDPFTLGAFSYWTPSFTIKDMDDLGQRIGNVYFAGEHINKTNYGFVHSAYTSGINTALELMSCIEDNSLCKNRVPTKEMADECTSDGHSITQYQCLSFVLLHIVVQMKNVLV